ncbi:N-acetyltransferase [Flavobacterium album]|uniref:N-acetyltransferase n=2 Tax=Flavobacterium album TaxID=2175091 RepID=A0A2S1R2Z1_9FLAO|nr:N-acetyltransferase [Flavobacterium album]
MNKLSRPIILHGEKVSLLPLEKSHFENLIALAKEKSIWQHYTIDGSDPEVLGQSLNSSLTDTLQYPFVIMLRETGTVIGSTRFLDIQPDHNKLEIGWTWLHPDYWHTKINTECKLMLLTFCFEELMVSRVQLKTDENNIRSRKAILKIGAQFEGLLRNDMIRHNGTKRNSAYFSIIDTEWHEVKEKLIALLS